MSISAFFERLGAPLTNSRWSWGGMDNANNRVFLRAWQDQTLALNGKRYVKLGHHQRYANDTENLGYRERLHHLSAARLSHQAYVVMCKARDVNTRPRAIESYNDRDVFKIGDLIEIDEDEWGEITDRIPVRTLI